MKSGTFDTLTKAVATSTSRRQALRRIAGILAGGTLGGAALAELSPGVALAGGGNSDCAHFCNAIFAPGSDRGQCKSDAAHGTGLCYSCGPKSSGGSQPICCSQNSNGQCTSYSSATCCSSGQTCTSGTCVAACPTGQILLSNGTCAQDCTSDHSICSCGFCGPDFTSGISYFCTNMNGSNAPCTSDATCPPGEFCDFLFGTSGKCQTAVIC